MKLSDDILFKSLVIGFFLSLLIGNAIYFIEPRLNQELSFIDYEENRESGAIYEGTGRYTPPIIINKRTTETHSKLSIYNVKLIKKEVCLEELRPSVNNPNYLVNKSICYPSEVSNSLPNTTVHLQKKTISAVVLPFHRGSSIIRFSPSENMLAEDFEDIFAIQNYFQFDYTLEVDGKKFNRSFTLYSISSSLDVMLDYEMSPLEESFEKRKLRLGYYYRELNELSIGEKIVGLLFLPFGELQVYGVLLGSPWIFPFLPFKPSTILLALCFRRFERFKDKSTRNAILAYYIWSAIFPIYIYIAMS